MAIITSVRGETITTDYIEEITIDLFVHIRSWVGTSLSDTIYMIGPIAYVEHMDDDLLCIHYEDGLSFFVGSHKPNVMKEAYEAYKKFHNLKY